MALKAEWLEPSVGRVPMRSERDQTPTSGMALAVLAAPDSSVAVTSTVAVLCGARVRANHAVCMRAQSSPVQNPPAGVGIGADSDPSDAAQVRAASEGLKLTMPALLPS